MKLISGTANESLARDIADVLDLPLTSVEIERFRDQEIFVRINENVRGEDIFLIQPTSAPSTGAGRPSVGACHAGWRGALGGIVESTVAAMCELGASPADMRAVLGPCIAPDSYEVGEVFKTEFTEVSEDYAEHFRPGPTGVPHFDLPGFVLSRLAACGVPDPAWTGQDTYADENAFFSYRRNTHQGISGYGRNLSAIMLPR